METNSLEILEKRIVTGWLPGCDQPVALVLLKIPVASADTPLLRNFDSVLADWLPGYQRVFTNTAPVPDPLAHLVLQLLDALHANSNTPRFAEAKYSIQKNSGQDVSQNISAPTVDGSVLLHLSLPVLGSAYTASLTTVEWVVHVLAGTAEQVAGREKRNLEKIQQVFASQAPPSDAVGFFVQCAIKRGIPWRHACNSVFQYGWGRKSRLLDSTFTEKTGNIATRVVSHKALAAAYLRSAGFPVPPHVAVANVTEALAAAERLGYPVVVKPVDRDGGLGVAAGLLTGSAVRQAYSDAVQYSKSVLVEKHIPGEDYRVYVYQGEVVWVMHRAPGGVTGDGKRSVQALLAEVNADPRRLPPKGRMTQIVLDAEAQSLLLDHALTANSIPVAGRFVPLRRTANVRTGGTPTTIELAHVHPDNLVLCARAVNHLRLDLGGVDLLIPDISRSWFETGAAICEVNSQPQLNLTLADKLLEKMVQGQGRIPVVVVVANQDKLPWLDRVIAKFKKKGVRIGLAHGITVAVAGDRVTAETCNAARAAQILFSDPLLDAAIFVLGTTEQPKSGMPVDRCDLLILASGAGAAIPGLPAFKADLVVHTMDETQMARQTSAVLEACL